MNYTVLTYEQYQAMQKANEAEAKKESYVLKAVATTTDNGTPVYTISAERGVWAANC